LEGERNVIIIFMFFKTDYNLKMTRMELFPDSRTINVMGLNVLIKANSEGT